MNRRTLLALTAAAAASPAAAASADPLASVIVVNALGGLNDPNLDEPPRAALSPRILKDAHGLSFAQIGMITFTFQVIAAALQPIVGMYTDRRPKPYSLPAGMSVTLIGVLLLSRAESYESILAAAALVGVGSSIFHPEASRMAHLAAGRKHDDRQRGPDGARQWESPSQLLRH